MNPLLALLAMAITMAIDPMDPGVTDLGLFTPNRVLVLEPSTNRSDLLHFDVELRHLSLPHATFFTTTNALVRIDQLDALPDGLIAMSLIQVCQDGSMSDSALFRFELRRSQPSLPTARIIGLIGPQGADDMARMPGTPSPGILHIPPRLQRQIAERRLHSQAAEGGPPLPASLMFHHFDRPGMRRSE